MYLYDKLNRDKQWFYFPFRCSLHKHLSSVIVSSKSALTVSFVRPKLVFKTVNSIIIYFSINYFANFRACTKWNEISRKNAFGICYKDLRNGLNSRKVTSRSLRINLVVWSKKTYFRIQFCTDNLTVLLNVIVQLKLQLKWL